MTRFATLIIGSALTSLVAGYGFAADTAPEASSPVAASPAPTAAAAVATPAAAETAPPAAAAATKEVKIGYINMNKVATETAEGKAATAKLTDKSEKVRKKLEAKQKQLEKQKKDLEGKLSTMPPKEREAKIAEFQKKMEEFQKQVRSSELEVLEVQDKLTSEVYLKIKDAAVGFAKANGYTMLVEEKSVLYVTEGLIPKNVTDEIVQTMDKKKAK